MYVYVTQFLTKDPISCTCVQMYNIFMQCIHMYMYVMYVRMYMHAYVHTLIRTFRYTYSIAQMQIHSQAQVSS